MVLAQGQVAIRFLCRRPPGDPQATPRSACSRRLGPLQGQGLSRARAKASSLRCLVSSALSRPQRELSGAQASASSPPQRHLARAAASQAMVMDPRLEVSISPVLQHGFWFTRCVAGVQQHLPPGVSHQQQFIRRGCRHASSRLLVRGTTIRFAVCRLLVLWMVIQAAALCCLLLVCGTCLQGEHAARCGGTITCATSCLVLCFLLLLASFSMSRLWLRGRCG